MKKKVHRSIKALILAVMLTFFAGSIAVSAENIFSINFDSYTINVGDEDKLELRIENLPENKKTKWVSWNENVAVVDQEGETGVVTAVRKGKAVISSGVGFPRETCVVTVVDPSIKLNKTAATIYCAPAESGNTNEFGGKTVQLKASVKGADKAVKWSSSDTKTAVVNQKRSCDRKRQGKCSDYCVCKRAGSKMCNCGERDRHYAEYERYSSEHKRSRKRGKACAGCCGCEQKNNMEKQ